MLRYAGSRKSFSRERLTLLKVVSSHLPVTKVALLTTPHTAEMTKEDKELSFAVKRLRRKKSREEFTKIYAMSSLAQTEIPPDLLFRVSPSSPEASGTEQTTGTIAVLPEDKMDVE